METKISRQNMSMGDLTAISGLLLSLLSIAWHCLNYFRGPELSMLPVEQVVFYAEAYPASKTYLHIAAGLSYINTGAPEFNDAIIKEAAVLDLEGTRYLLKWGDFVSLTISQSRLAHPSIENAHPVTINARGSESHTTAFLPLPCDREELPADLKENAPGKYCTDEWHNYLEWQGFIERIKSIPRIPLIFYAETSDGEILMKACSVTIDPRHMDEEMKKRGFFVGSCQNE